MTEAATERLTLMLDKVLLGWLQQQGAANQRSVRDQLLWVLRQAKEASQMGEAA